MAHGGPPPAGFLFCRLIQDRVLQITRHEESFRGFITRRLGLALDDPLETLLERLDDLREPAAMESLDDQDTIRLEMRAGKFQGQITDVLYPGGICHPYARQVGGHIRDYKIYRVISDAPL